MAPASSARPLLRGISHRVAFHVAIVAGAILIVASGDARARIATAIYIASLAGMFGVSATLHRADWGPRAFGWLRRADHAMIFVCIAGTYTPLCLLGVDSPRGNQMLALEWAAAGLGILRAVLWPHAPRVISSGLYIAVGWVMAVYLPDVHRALDPFAFALVIGGGALFTVGALIYLLRWPDPWPRVFGYHEVFHVLIILGCTSHFVAVCRVVHT
jgi:hemolysin III